MKNMLEKTLLTIERATVDHSKILADIGAQTFLDAYGKAALKENSEKYVAEKFSENTVQAELNNDNTIFHLIHSNGKPVGYSKIILNHSNEFIIAPNISKMERLYILKEYHGKNMGQHLFEFNREICIKHQQAAMWLTVWVNNPRAISFYERIGFKKVGESMFNLAGTLHLNFVMCLHL